MKRFLFQMSICIIGLMAHFLYESLDLYRALSSLGGAPLGDYITTYTDRFEFLNGLTVGLLLSFFAYVISKYITTKNIEGILRGCIISTVIFIVPVFFLGCFGPFFSFYVKKIGLFYEFLITPILLLLTIISTSVGYVKIKKV